MFRRLLDSPGAAGIVSSGLPDPTNFGAERLCQLAHFADAVLACSMDAPPASRRQRRLKRVIRQNAMVVARSGELATLTTTLSAEGFAPLPAEDLSHVHAAMREGVLCGFYDALCGRILHSVSKQAGDAVPLPSPELAWIRAITVSTVAAALYDLEPRLLDDQTFRWSDEPTRQYLRLRREQRPYTANAIPSGRTRGHLLAEPFLLTASMLAAGGWLGMPVASLALLAPLLFGITQHAQHVRFVVGRKHTFLPAYDIGTGPAAGTIAVAVPVLVHRCIDVTALAGRVRSNLCRQGVACIAVLLTDFEDRVEPYPAPDEDERLRSLANAMATAFCDAPDRWLILHRERVFAPRQGVHMGWERKRGKVLQFCRYLDSGADAFPIKFNAERAMVRAAKWVLVTDEDSLLAEGTVDRLVAAGMHPANDDRHGGHRRGIVAPVIATLPDTGARWRLDWMFCGRVSRNPWFEMSGEVPFAGKGLFRASELASRSADVLPEGRILSHDTLEGYLLGTAYCETAFLADRVPSSYRAISSRLQRWVRGDLQNLMYGRRAIANAFGRAHSRSLLFHRIGQFVLPFALVACTQGLAGHDRLPYAIALAVLLFGVPAATLFARSCTRFVPSVRYVVAELVQFSAACARSAFRVVMAAHVSAIVAHAAWCVAIRGITGRCLLQWTTSSEDNARGRRLDGIKWSSAGAAACALLLLDASTLTRVLLSSWVLFPVLSAIIFTPRRSSETDRATSHG